MTTAKAIQALREGMGLEQQEFANRLGVTVTTISRYENSRREPTRQVLKKLEEAAEKNGIGYLYDYFAAKRRAGIISRIKNSAPSGSERHIPFDEIESWANWLKGIEGQLEEAVYGKPGGSNGLEQRLPRELYNTLQDELGNIRGAIGTVAYVRDEIQIYIDGSKASQKPKGEQYAKKTK
jgi:transcriptional regulator with XRE-family HTH domain